MALAPDIEKFRFQEPVKLSDVGGAEAVILVDGDLECITGTEESCFVSEMEGGWEAHLTQRRGGGRWVLGRERRNDKDREEKREKREHRIQLG